MFSLWQIKKKKKKNLKQYFGERLAITLTYIGKISLQMPPYNCGNMLSTLQKFRKISRKLRFCELLEVVISNIQKYSDSFHYNFPFFCLKKITTLRICIQLGYN